MGNAMATLNDLTGRVFGRLTAVSRKEKPLQVWLKESGIKRDTYYRRVRKGFTKQEALQQGEAK